jgi:vitamin B12 transporter
MKINHACLIAILLWAVSIRAQSTTKIEGRVYDSRSGDPLTGVQIVVVGSAVNAVSDAQGAFYLENLLVGDYVVEAGCIGYETQRKAHVSVQYDRPTRITFKLSSKLIEMPAVDVVAESQTKSREQATTIIDQTAIRRANAQDLAELLQNTCGVDIQDSGAQKSVSIRGSQGSQVLVLLDGVRLGDGVSDAVDVTSIPVSIIDRIEIYKGARSSSFGANAIAGVVQIITKQVRKNRLSAAARHSSLGGLDVTSSIMQKHRVWEYMFSYERNINRNDYDYSYTLGEEQIADRRQNADVFQQHLFGRAGVDRPAGQLFITGQVSNSERGLPGAVYSWTPYARSHTQRSMLLVSLARKRSGYSLTSRHSFSRDFTDYKNIYDDVALRYRMVPPYWNDHILKQLQNAIEYTRFFSSKTSFHVGGEVNRLSFQDQDRLLEGMAPIGEAEAQTGGLFSRYSREIFLGHGIRMEWQPSLRFDLAQTTNGLIKRWDRVWSPGLGSRLRVPWHADWTLSANWNRGFRLPTFADLFYQQYRVRGNPDLLPERSNQYELALELLTENHLLRFSHYHNRVLDLIIWRMGSFATFSPVNVDALLTGEELEWTWAARRHLQLALSYAHLDSRNLSGERTTHGKQLPYRPEHTLKANLQWQWHGFSIEYSGRWAGKRYVTEANTVSLEGFLLHDLTVAAVCHALSLEHQFKISCLNLSDSPYQLLENAPLPGREWRLAWQIVF